MTVTDDKNVIEQLLDLLQDSVDGLTAAAEMLSGSDRRELEATFQGFATQRAKFSTELEALAAAHGTNPEQSGSVKAAVHRAWMSVKDTLSGSDPAGILEVAVLGEEHAVSTYTEALENEISSGLRSVLEHQLLEVRRAHVEVRILSENAR